MTLGLLMASFSAMQFLFAPIWGRVSDRVGRRPILILGLAGSTASYALFGYATSLGKDTVWLGMGVIAVVVHHADRRGDRRGDDSHGPGLHRRRHRRPRTRQGNGAHRGGVRHRLHLRPAHRSDVRLRRRQRTSQPVSRLRGVGAVRSRHAVRSVPVAGIVEQGTFRRHGDELVCIAAAAGCRSRRAASG